MRIYERAIAKVPNDPAGPARLARLLLDDARFKRGDPKERARRALDAARRAVQLTERKNANYLGHLAEAEFRTGDRDAARNTVAEALQRVHGAEPRVRERLAAAAERYR